MRIATWRTLAVAVVLTRILSEFQLVGNFFVFPGTEQHPNVRTGDDLSQMVEGTAGTTTSGTHPPFISHYDYNASVVDTTSPATIPHTTMYSWARNDRSGAAIMDMLLAHAYAHAHNYTYAGACPKKKIRFRKNKSAHLQLIEELGLGHVLRFECPTADTNQSLNTTIMVPDSHYQLPLKNTRDLWTPDWLRSIYSLQKLPWLDQKQKRHHQQQANREKKQVAVHIRRGDVALCQSQGLRDRYIPNRFYAQLLSRYFGSDDSYTVTVYSESTTFEDWKDLTDRIADTTKIRIHFALDTPLPSVWRALMEANVVVVARSSFSLVPAIFNRGGTILYPKYMYDPLDHFTVIDDDLLELIEEEKVRLERERCPG